MGTPGPADARRLVPVLPFEDLSPAAQSVCISILRAGAHRVRVVVVRHADHPAKSGYIAEARTMCFDGTAEAVHRSIRTAQPEEGLIHLLRYLSRATTQEVV